MSRPASADAAARVQLVIDVLARAVNRAVLLDDASLTPISYSRQLGVLDDVRMYSVLQRGTPAEIKAALAAMGIRTATEAFRTPAVPEKNMMPRFCVPVCSPGDRFGYLWVLDPDMSLSEQGQRLAARPARNWRSSWTAGRLRYGPPSPSASSTLVGRLLACGHRDPRRSDDVGCRNCRKWVSNAAGQPGQRLRVHGRPRGPAQPGRAHHGAAAAPGDDVDSAQLADPGRQADRDPRGVEIERPCRRGAPAGRGGAGHRALLRPAAEYRVVRCILADIRSGASVSACQIGVEPDSDRRHRRRRGRLDGAGLVARAGAAGGQLLGSSVPPIWST